MNRWIVGPLLAILALSVTSALQQRHPLSYPKNPIRAERLNQSRLTSRDKEAIVAVVFRAINPSECIPPGSVLQKEIESIRIAQVRLGSGAERHLLVQASDNCQCGGTGNCAFWVLRRNGKAFDVLLETSMVQIFAVEDSRTKGYKDLVTASHGSAFENGLVLYQFDGKRYRATECADSVYERDENDNVSKQPKITKVPCAQEE